MREFRSFHTHLPPPATRGSHPPPEVLSPTFAPLHAAKPHLHLCTVSLPPHALALTRCIPCQRVNMPACPLAQALVPVSPCQHVPSRPLVASRFSDPKVRPDPVFGPRLLLGWLSFGGLFRFKIANTLKLTLSDLLATLRGKFFESGRQLSDKVLIDHQSLFLLVSGQFKARI